MGVSEQSWQDDGQDREQRTLWNQKQMYKKNTDFTKPKKIFYK